MSDTVKTAIGFCPRCKKTVNFNQWHECSEGVRLKGFHPALDLSAFDVTLRNYVPIKFGTDHYLFPVVVAKCPSCRGEMMPLLEAGLFSFTYSQKSLMTRAGIAEISDATQNGDKICLKCKNEGKGTFECSLCLQNNAKLTVEVIDR